MNNTATLNKRRVYYANRAGQVRTGHWRGFNCWGATKFVLGANDRLEWVNGWEMQRWLKLATGEIYRPAKAGDILAVWEYGLSHTAVYLGNGKYFHKRESNTSEITTLAGVRKIYRGKCTWHRALTPEQLIAMEVAL